MRELVFFTFFGHVPSCTWGTWHIVDHIEETYTESHKKISVDSVNGSHRNSTLKLFLSCSWRRGQEWVNEWVSDNNHLYWTFCSSFLWIIFSNKSSEILHWLSAFIQLYTEIIDDNILIYIILISWTFFLYNECFLVLKFIFLNIFFYFISKIL